jgi:hypothetical protein
MFPWRIVESTLEKASNGCYGRDNRRIDARAGHSSTPAALRYQHATQSRGRVLGEALGEMLKPGLTAPKETKNKDQLTSLQFSRRNSLDFIGPE